MRARHLRFERFSSQQGLSQSIVECGLVDQEGFLWFGTEDGLNRFDGYEFRVFRHRVEDRLSLSYSEVKCFAEAASGDLWVGTFGGLNRFDPVAETFERFVHRPEDPQSLASDIVRALSFDREGSLWIGTQGGGLDRLEVSTGHIVHHRHDAGEPGSLAHDDVRALLEDARGRLWIGTLGSGLDRLDPGADRFVHHRHDPEDPESLSHDEVTAMHQDALGRLWVGTRGGLNRLDDRTGRFVRYRAGGDGIAHDRVSAICETADGGLWIGTDGGGLDRLDPKRGSVDHYRHDPHDSTSLSTDRVISLCLDDSGQLWVGTYGGSGLNKVDPRGQRFSHLRCHPDDPQSLCHAIVWSLWEDRDGVLWVGTDGGLDRIDRRTGEVRHILAEPENPQALGHPAVRVVYEAPSGGFWVGTNGGLHRYDRETGRFERFTHDAADPGSLSHDEIRSLHEDSSGTLWIGTLGGGLDRFDAEAGTFTAFRHDPRDPGSIGSDFIRPIHEDREGRLWIGMQGGGLDRFDRRTGRFVHFRHDPEDPRSLSSDYVFSIWEDADGIFWLGTYAGGLDRFDPRTGHVRRYTEADGLPANLIYGVLGDSDGNLWISSNRGLTRFDPRSERFRTYDWRDGLQADEFNGGSFHLSASGELFFGGIDGFNSFFAADLEDSSFEAPVVLTDFRLSGRSVRPGERIDGHLPLAGSLTTAEEIRLRHSDRVLSFRFAGLDFTNPGKNRYAFRMVGFDEEWRHTGADDRSASYTNLAPGSYRFRVRATNCDGVWSRREASVRVKIAPPIWGTWWFRGLAAAATTAVAARVYRRRVHNIRLETELDAAREAQLSIWPQGDPHLPGFEIAAASLPASEVGGDFFDFIWSDAERRKLCIAIGDVAGKGMRAAMTAVLSTGMIAAQLEGGGGLQGALESVNRLAFRKMSARKFTALSLVCLEAPKRLLSYVNAGMTEPVLRSRNGVLFLGTDTPRFPLGILENVAYDEGRVQLEPGDLLVLYTDGVPEAQSPSGEVYGYDALGEWLAGEGLDELSAAQILQALVAEVQRFREDSPQQDDMTMIVVKTLAAERASAG
jgi:ligand-binding sensor domain-containing protein/serine phosphatase RsbU (regulator of sigma subunit)